jgi:hypothetical protein
MRKYLSEAWARLWGFLVNRYGPLPLVGVGFAVFFLLIGIFAEEWLGLRWQEFVNGWQALLDLRIGFFGLVVFALLIGLMFLAFIDTSPVALVFRQWLNRNKTKASVILTLDEKEAIARLRTLWHDDGGAFCAQQMASMLQKVKEELSEKHYAGFYDWLIANLGTKCTAFEADLASNSEPLPKVIAGIEAANGAFLRACEDLYEAHQQGDIDLGSEAYRDSYRRLLGRHDKFYREISVSNNYPLIDGVLKMFIPNPVFTGPLASRKFLRQQAWDGDAPFPWP